MLNVNWVPSWRMFHLAPLFCNDRTVFLFVPYSMQLWSWVNKLWIWRNVTLSWNLKSNQRWTRQHKKRQCTANNNLTGCAPQHAITETKCEKEQMNHINRPTGIFYCNGNIQTKLNKVRAHASPLFHQGCGLFLCRWLIKYAARSLIGYLICWSIVTALHCPERCRKDTYTYCIKGLRFHRRGQRTHTQAHTHYFPHFPVIVLNHRHLEAILNFDWQINTLPFSHSASSVRWLVPPWSHPDVNCL